jgi:hypothetical protein
LVLNRPELAEEQLFIFAQSWGATGNMRTFSLVDAGMFVPEPSATLLLLWGAGAAFLARCPMMRLARRNWGA